MVDGASGKKAWSAVSGTRSGKPFDSMNGIAANLLLHLTSSVRFEGPLNGASCALLQLYSITDVCFVHSCPEWSKRVICSVCFTVT
jgi:hypothetical protein